MTNGYDRTKCQFCGRFIKWNGLGYSSHMRMHVRRGEAIEKSNNGFRGISDYYWYESDAYLSAMQDIKEKTGFDYLDWAVSDILSKTEDYYLSVLKGYVMDDQGEFSDRRVVLYYGDELWQMYMQKALNSKPTPTETKRGDEDEIN